jgi:H+-translocating NAD(P) transhydrogenase subunit alpha
MKGYRLYYKKQFALHGSFGCRNNIQLQTINMDQITDFFIQHYSIITIVILSVFLGIEIIGRVPSVLHTPLMSGANAIHGVVVIGAIIIMGEAEADNYLALTLGFLAVVLGTLNVVGGFVVTDRMLEMFKKKKKPN